MPAPARAANFRVVVQGSTPKDQTIPHAELSAVAWTALWLKRHPFLSADLYTDSAYALMVWQKVSSQASVAGLAQNLDLAACLLGCTTLQVYKVKAHASAAMKAAAAWRTRQRRRQADVHQRSFLEWTRPGTPGQPEFAGTMGQRFPESLYVWARLLDWPHLPLPVQDDLSCTYLELLTNYVVWSGRLPPTPLVTSSGREYIPSLSPQARLQPQTLEEFVGTFQAALLFLASQDQSLLPARRLQGISHLKALGLPRVQHGLDRRPFFVHAPGWVPLLSDTCQIRNASLLLAHCRRGDSS